MKLNEDPLQVNMNTVELVGKKVIIGEDRQPRMIRPKNLKIG
jgi:hypothetical protein